LFLVLKDRLKNICGDDEEKGSGNVKELKKIIQQQPQLIDEVRNHLFLIDCFHDELLKMTF
jgi:hypothetical protein